MGILEGKVAIITGAGQGIGRGMALAFAKEGAKVVVAERNAETANAVVGEISVLGKQALALVCDVGNEEQVKGMVEQAVAHFGQIGILVNNAQARGTRGRGPDLMIPFEDVPEEVWDNTFQTGVKATFYCCKAVFPYMKERGGKIINFGSTSGIQGQKGLVDYNANKEAVRALTRTAAREWGKYKINVNVICPSALTAGQKAWAEAKPEAYQAFLRQVPLGRSGDPERDLGRAAVFLASPDSDFITGQTFMVDGGSYMFP